jgi:hypothetical protein
MTDEELLLQAAGCPTMYFDGFGAYRMSNGVLRTVGYVIGPGAQLNLIVSLRGAEAAALNTVNTLKPNKAVKALQIWNVPTLAH